jgi:uncharacterized protein YggE
VSARSISPAGWIASCCGFSALACGQQLAPPVGVRPVRILSVVENLATDGPVREVMMARMQDSAATPIEPGTIEVSSTVTLTVEVASR